MPDLIHVAGIVVIGATYADLEYSLDNDLLSGHGDLQVFSEATVRLGGTGHNQASLLHDNSSSNQSVELVTILGDDPASQLVSYLLDSDKTGIKQTIIKPTVSASPPIINIIYAGKSERRRLMIGPEHRYISRIWDHLEI